VKVKEIWNEIFGSPALRVTMSITCFETLIVCTLFDKSFRLECKARGGMKNLQLSEESGIFSLQNVKCITDLLYTFTVDKLHGLRWSCPLTIYIQNKPDKFCIKIWHFIMGSNFT
jgi:hypothetical protein